jgi:hypothetical protein
MPYEHFMATQVLPILLWIVNHNGLSMHVAFTVHIKIAVVAIHSSCSQQNILTLPPILTSLHSLRPTCKR